MLFEGTVHVLGDNVDHGRDDTRPLSFDHEPAEIAKHIFEEVDPGFVKRVKPGDILFAGKNFGAGSGREHAPLGLKALGISCIVASSFSRTFYRMAIDLGLPILVWSAAAHTARQGQCGGVDTQSGEIILDGQRYETQPLPDFVQDIVDEGGLTNWVKSEVQRRQARA